jgi:hypothetical protein
MNADDEQLLRGRVYSCDHDDPYPGPFPHRTYAVLAAARWTGCCSTSRVGGRKR